MQLNDLWSALLRSTRRFNGAPMPMHMTMIELTAASFERCMPLFRATIAELGDAPIPDIADDIAACIRGTFWRRFCSLRWLGLPLHPASGRPSVPPTA